MKLPVALFIFASILCQCNSQNVPENITTPVELIEFFGYPVEVHTVETKDGYLLEMHRIPPRVTNVTDPAVEKRRKFPVFYGNSLFGNSGEILLLGPKKSLVLLLSDLGFDIWLGNFRGNPYSRAHKALSPNDRKFWDFSWHESGVYDLPAQIDYVLNATKREKIIFSACSMGTTTFLVMMSVLPEYKDKIEMAILMAPVAYMKNVKSVSLRSLIPFLKNPMFVNVFFKNGEIFRRHEFILEFLHRFCTMNKIGLKICEISFFSFSGFDSEELDEDNWTYYLKFYPTSYSVKGVNHYGQLVESGGFRQYDYGPGENMRRYNSTTPPDYDLTKITVDTYLYVGPNDFLGDETDAVYLAKKIPGLKKFHRVDRSRFNHFDFIVGRHTKQILYDVILQDIETHLAELDFKKRM